MIPLTALWLPILLSAVIVFFASAIMPTPRNRFGTAEAGWLRSSIFSIALFTRR